MRLDRRGQATTEVVLVFPFFMFFLFVFAKVFALLILVQKMEIASYYAARRWQLESHRNVDYEGWDKDVLRLDIQDRVKKYLGVGTGNEKFLGIDGSSVLFDCERTQVWNICTLSLRTTPIDVAWMYSNPGVPFKITKYVPNRDRPIAFVLPGLKE